MRGERTTKTSAVSAAKGKKRTTKAHNQTPATPAGVSNSTAPSEEVDALRVSCLMNARYHSSREAFLDSVHRWLMFGVIVAGAGVVNELFEVLSFPKWLTAIFGAAAVVFGSLDLTFDLSNRARIHTMMKRKYFELLADLEEGNKSLRQAEACLYRYSAEEEPPYHALLCSCYNAAMEMVYGDDGDRYDIPGRHLRLQNFRRFEGKTYPLKLALPKPSASSATEPA